MNFNARLALISVRLIRNIRLLRLVYHQTKIKTIAFMYMKFKAKNNYYDKES